MQVTPAETEASPIERLFDTTGGKLTLLQLRKGVGRNAAKPLKIRFRQYYQQELSGTHRHFSGNAIILPECGVEVQLLVAREPPRNRPAPLQAGVFYADQAVDFIVLPKREIDLPGILAVMEQAKTYLKLRDSEIFSDFRRDNPLLFCGVVKAPMVA
jgi:hypothetical protein